MPEPFVVLSLLVLAQTPSAPPLGPAPQDLGSQVRQVFITKCAQCHGPQVARPKGKFGFVTDLVKLAATPAILVPGDPDQSDIWDVIDSEEMPPQNAKAGPLTDAEKELILKWIKDGAPPPKDAAGSTPAVAPTSPAAPVTGPSGSGATTKPPAKLPPQVRAEESALDKYLTFAGRFHLLILHFPIALLISAAAAELWGGFRKTLTPLPAVRFCLGLGALSAIVTAGLGWLHALDNNDGPATLLFLHRWIGTAVGVLAPAVFLLSERDSRRSRRSGLASLAIVVLAIGVGIVAHYGGILTNGEGYFTP